MEKMGREESLSRKAPELYHIVQDMAMVARYNATCLYREDPLSNAFATGSKPKMLLLSRNEALSCKS